MAQTRTRYRVDLAAEHARCETNYARLLRLLPALACTGTALVGLPASRPDAARVRFSVTERAAYTTSLDVQVEQPVLCTASGQPLPFTTSPRLVFSVRLYHDACMAEVVAFQQQRRPAPRQAYPNPAMQQPDEKAQWNRFLGDWLAYCQEHGYSLAQVDLSSRDEAAP